MLAGASHERCCRWEVDGKGKKWWAGGFRADLRRDASRDTTTAVKWVGAELRLKLGELLGIDTLGAVPSPPPTRRATSPTASS